MNNNAEVILITGASSGIGKAAAQYLANKGYKVYGTSRKADSEKIETLIFNDRNNGFFKLIYLDVTKEESVDKCVETVIKAEGKLDVLINNAGFGIAGAIEDTSIEEAKSQFDTNFFGVLSLCSKVLPFMREQRKGLIINTGSVAGMISIPFQAMYSAAKYALEAYSEALRIEVKPFGINVSIIEPGDTKTGFTANRQFTLNSKSPDSKYKARMQKSIAVMEKDETNGGEPEKAVKCIYSLIRSKNPPVRKVIGLDYKFFVILKRILPSFITEFIISKMYGF